MAEEKVGRIFYALHYNQDIFVIAEQKLQLFV
jgi:hypothetical protein